MQKVASQNGDQKIEIAFAIGIKTAGDILMKFPIWFRCFLT